MGLNTIPIAADGTVIPASDHNSLRAAMLGDFVPRDNTSGAPEDLAGNLGSDTYKWLKAFIESGYWSAGDIKAHHSYNGTVGPGHGWMLCDGRVINEANYDLEHGDGTWASHIASSPLDGKYLPNLTGKYLVGKETTTQTGSSALTFVGNASHQINISHSHTVNSHSHTGPSHVHQWYVPASGLTLAKTYESGGSAVDLATANHSAMSLLTGTGTSSFNLNAYTAASGTQSTGPSSPGTNPQLSATQSIQPESLEVQYFMRII